MSTTSNGIGLNLTGAGAVYFRVSGDRQEVKRQRDSVAAFEQRHGVKIPQRCYYEDHMPRDLSAKRPDFQRMLRAVKAGGLRWIVVDQIDRFGFADEWELVELIRDLRKAGCKLYDTKDDEWTAGGLMSFFKAGLAGHSSHDEQVKKSSRCLGGMIAKAKNGEWQGGPPKLGFDVACFDRATGKELWRVVYEGREVVGKTVRRGKERPVYSIRRLKVYPGGGADRLDGNVVFRTSKETQVMRIVPTRDKAKLEAAQGVFRRYAAEAVTFFDLAKWLNGLGIRNSFGKLFQSRDISKMLADEAYLGYPTFSKRRAGRFHRVGAGGVKELEPELNGKDTESDPENVIRSDRRMFDPLVDRPTWDTVQKKVRARKMRKQWDASQDKKIDDRPPPGRGPKNPALFLAGLVTCAQCGQPMVARTDRMEYYCGTWDKHRTRGSLDDSPCERNGVRQAVLEEYVNKYLDEVGRRLELLTAGPEVGHLTDRLEAQEADAWHAFREGIRRLTAYLADHHPAEYNNILRSQGRQAAEDEANVRANVGSPGAPAGTIAELYGRRPAKARGQAMKSRGSDTHDFIDACIDCYRANFDPAAVEAELSGLRAEYERLVEGWRDLPTQRAKDTAKRRLEPLEARMAELERQQQDAGEVVATHYRKMQELQLAVAAVRSAMNREAGVHAFRRLAEHLRGLLVGINCEFVATGKGGKGGPGNARSKLVALTFLPVAGDVRSYAGPNVGENSHGKP